MSIYIIGDLHLSFGVKDKPMDVFGNNWFEHWKKVEEDWKEKVKEDDVVILNGDFSWATYLEETYEDFKFLNSLPGKKILLKGNHDYWWTTLKSMNTYLVDNKFENIEFLYNNSYECEDICIVGTRGWSLLDSDNSEKMMNREIQRLELSIKDAIEKYGDQKEIICCMHYPPIVSTKIENLYENKYIQIMNKYNIHKCYYAHLHGNSHIEAIQGIYSNIDFELVSADYLNFKLKKVR